MKPRFVRAVAAVSFVIAFLIPASLNAWQMQTAALMTDYAPQVDPTNTLPEYPRPQMVRTNWMNLNGIWQFQAGATYPFTVRVTDNGSPNLSATQNFQVAVAALAKPSLDSFSINNSVFQMRVSGDGGPDYTIQTSTNLALSNAWFSAFTTNSPALPFFWTDFGVVSNPAQFYRILLSP